MFGRPLIEQAEADDTDVPVIVTKCILAVEDNGMEYEGPSRTLDRPPVTTFLTIILSLASQVSTESLEEARSPSTSPSSSSAGTTTRSTWPTRTGAYPSCHRYFHS
jgi:hypothetical protein